MLSLALNIHVAFSRAAVLAKFPLIGRSSCSWMTSYVLEYPSTSARSERGGL